MIRYTHETELQMQSYDEMKKAKNGGDLVEFYPLETGWCGSRSRLVHWVRDEVDLARAWTEGPRSEVEEGQAARRRSGSGDEGRWRGGADPGAAASGHASARGSASSKK